MNIWQLNKMNPYGESASAPDLKDCSGEVEIKNQGASSLYTATWPKRFTTGDRVRETRRKEDSVGAGEL